MKILKPLSILIIFLMTVVLISILKNNTKSHHKLSASEELQQKIKIVDKELENYRKIDEIANTIRIEKEAIKLDNSWNKTNYITGENTCYNLAPELDYSLGNELNLNVTTYSDAVIKLVNKKTKNCVRSVFIANKTRVTLKGIPAGKYTLNITYGNAWYETLVNNQCQGKFLNSALYRQYNGILDFSRTNTITLDLDIYYENVLDAAKFIVIDEAKFNNIKAIVNNDYPTNVIQNFIKSCITTPNSDQKICECLFDKVQKKYSFEEFAAIEAKIANGEMPPDFKEFARKSRLECGNK